MSHWTKRLRALRACEDAVAWARAYPDLATAWAACERGDWMLWLAGRVSGEPGSDARRPLVLAACECARIALPIWEAQHPSDSRPRTAIETAERWARGDGTTLEDVRMAAAAAYSAAVAAAYSAAVAYADADADAAAAAAYSAAVADRTRVLRECADIVRRHYPVPPEIGS